MLFLKMVLVYWIKMNINNIVLNSVICIFSNSKVIIRDFY